MTLKSGKTKTYHGDTEKSGKFLPLINTDDTDLKRAEKQKPTTERGDTEKTGIFYRRFSVAVLGFSDLPLRSFVSFVVKVFCFPDHSEKQKLTADQHG